MAHYNTLMSELMHLIPRHRFETVVKSLSGDRYVKRFDCWDQLTVLLNAKPPARTACGISNNLSEFNRIVSIT